MDVGCRSRLANSRVVITLATAHPFPASSFFPSPLLCVLLLFCVYVVPIRGLAGCRTWDIARRSWRGEKRFHENKTKRGSIHTTHRISHQRWIYYLGHTLSRSLVGERTYVGGVACRVQRTRVLPPRAPDCAMRRSFLASHSTYLYRCRDAVLRLAGSRASAK